MKVGVILEHIDCEGANVIAAYRNVKRANQLADQYNEENEFPELSSYYVVVVEVQ